MNLGSLTVLYILDPISSCKFFLCSNGLYRASQQAKSVIGICQGDCAFSTGHLGAHAVVSKELHVSHVV